MSGSKLSIVDLCVQAVLSSPLFASASATERAGESTRVKSSAADVATLSETTHDKRATSGDTGVPVVKAVQELPKPSSVGVGKPTVEDSVPGKRGTTLFTDDDDADDLFASPVPSKVVTLFILCHSVIYIIKLLTVTLSP